MKDPVQSPGRLQSLDVFRGATIASMILVNNPGSWQHIYPPLEHAEWHGWTFTDTVFPFFLWIIGVAMTLSFAKRVERGGGRRHLLGHVIRRGLIIFGLGFGLNLLASMSFATVRIPGVLQRIGICYLIAGTIFLYTRLRGQVWSIVGLLALYWALMTFGGGTFDKEGNFAQKVDQLFLTGHMWRQTRTWDPEGIVSTLPAIASVLFGALAGHLLRTRLSMADKAAWLMSAGGVMAGAAHFLSFWMPVNKNLWTCTFALFMAGLAALVFGIWYWLIDVQGYGRWTRPLAIYGMNAIVVYVLSGLLARYAARSGVQEWLMANVFNPAASPVNASLLYAVCNVLLLYLAAWIMYRRGWFVRF